MCFQAIVEIAGSAIGVFIIAIIAVFCIIFLGTIFFAIIFTIGGIILNILLLLMNPLTWIVLIVLALLGIFLFK